MLPFTFYKKPGAEKEVERILKLMGIDHRKEHLPSQISGGEMQRVAIPERWSQAQHYSRRRTYRESGHEKEPGDRRPAQGTQSKGGTDDYSRDSQPSPGENG